MTSKVSEVVLHEAVTWRPVPDRDFAALCGMCGWQSAFASEDEAKSALDRHAAAHRAGKVSDARGYLGAIEVGDEFWWQPPYGPLTPVRVVRIETRATWPTLIVVAPCRGARRAWKEQRAIVADFRRDAVLA